MIQVICFSRARPLQLHGYLTSLYKNWPGVEASVLGCVDESYAEAYRQIEDEFQDVVWLHESNFAVNLNALIDPDIEYTCFGCDDVVFTAPISAGIETMLGQETSLLGWSLRLGDHIKRDMFGSPMAKPAVAPESYGWDFMAPEGAVDQLYAWDFTVWDVMAPGSAGDWAYPWEVLGTVYRTEFVQRMVRAISPGSPSQLEERGSKIWQQHTDQHHMAAFGTARLVVPTVNVVQHEFPNGIKGPKPLSPEILLECWNNGLRLDTERYAWVGPESWRVPEFYLKRVT